MIIFWQSLRLHRCTHINSDIMTKLEIQGTVICLTSTLGILSGSVDISSVINNKTYFDSPEKLTDLLT